MPIKTYRLGAGTLKLGTDPAALDVSAQVRAARVSCAVSVNRTDPVPVLSGESLPGTVTRTYEWTLAATVLQDITDAGMVDWTWDHKGEPIAFEFVPSTAAGRACTGVLMVAPLDFGGDVGGDRPEAAISWPAGGAATDDGDDITGDPVLSTIP